MSDLEARLRDAVQRFWITRGSQATRQSDTGDRDRGGRGAVTGGKQMDGFVNLVRDLLVEARVPESSIATNRRVELPGWFRAEKKWDLVVVHQDELLAALEFKSQIGPSFGNNFNNRTEEALGSATDLWAAYREGAFKPSSRPFLGYLMLLEDCEGSRSSVKVFEPQFKVFPEFREASYQGRYALFVEKLLRERLYDGACLILAEQTTGLNGRYIEPHPELTFTKLIRPLLSLLAGKFR